jgi:hypothetical protein
MVVETAMKNVCAYCLLQKPRHWREVRLVYSLGWFVEWLSRDLSFVARLSAFRPDLAHGHHWVL